MTSSKSHFIIQCIIPMALLAAAVAPTPAFAQGVQKRETQEAYENSANKHVKNAVSVVKRLESDPTMQRVMIDAKGIYIVPTYGRAALGIGGQGGAGVLLIRQGPDWSDPAFYNIGGISIGAQVGAEGGAVAFVLKNEKPCSASPIKTISR